MSDLPTVQELIDERWAEWNFDGVPDHELVACCHWEYARESWTLGMEAKLYWLRTREIHWKKEYLADPELKRRHDERAVEIEAWLAEFNYDGDAFSDAYWASDLSCLELYRTLTDHGGPDTAPWQQLDQEYRAALVSQAKKSWTLRPLGPALVGELEQLWTNNSRELIEIRSLNLPPDDDSEDCALYYESTPVAISDETNDQLPKLMTVGFTIDFSRFTDREIMESFSEWIKRSRPAHWKSPKQIIPGPSRRGSKLLDYRVALERLGLMRLLHENSPDELREFHPEAWEKMCRDETHFRRECRFACEMFRRLFPFLPEGELPLSSEPLEIWEPKILKQLAEEKEESL